MPGASCRAGYSTTAATNRASGVEVADVAVNGRQLAVAKDADGSTTTPGGRVDYTAEVTVPFVDAGGVPTGPAFDVTIVDTLPADMTYIEGSANEAGAGSGQTVTWVIDRLDPGDTIRLTYSALVSEAVTDESPPLVNEVSVTGVTAPGGAAGAEQIGPVTAQDSVVVGAPRPALTKVADKTVVGIDKLAYEIEVVWPATEVGGPQWFDVLLSDVVPPGFDVDLSSSTLVCSPDPCPVTPLSSEVGDDGSTHMGFTASSMGPFLDEQTWVWTYTVLSDGETTLGDEIPLGSQHDNKAEVRYNAIDRLGGVVPDLQSPFPSDGTIVAVAPVIYDRPLLSLSKETVTPSPVDLTPDGITYRITVSNTGGVEARDVVISDSLPGANGERLGNIAPATVTAVPGTSTATATSWGEIEIDTIPAGGSVEVTYQVVWGQGVTGDGIWVNRAQVSEYAAPNSDGGLTGYEDNQPFDSSSVRVLHPMLEISKATLAGSPSGGGIGEELTFRVTITNVGDGTAYNTSGEDAMPGDATFVPGSGCEFDWSGDTFRVNDPIAPGASVTCDVVVTLDEEVDAGTYLNEVTIEWSDGIGNEELMGGGQFTPFVATASAPFDVVDPTIAITKTPDASDPGNVIISGQSGAYTIRLSNPSPIPATNVQLSDPLPATLTLDSAPIVTSVVSGAWTAGVEYDVVSGGTPGASGFEFSIGSLAPGESITVEVPVLQDGVRPPGDQLLNTATVTLPKTGLEVSDPGVLAWLPELDPPTVAKTVTPSEGSPGSLMTWTITAVVPDNDIDLYDVTFVDILPDGIDFGGYGPIACSGAGCGAVSAVGITPTLPTPNGSTRLGWRIEGSGGGNALPANSGEMTFTFELEGTVAATFEGEGYPADGADTAGTLVRNTVRPHFNVLDPAPGDEPDLAAGDSWQFRGGLDAAAFQILGPRIEVDKAITNVPAAEWTVDPNIGVGHHVNAGQTIGYEIVVTNSGTGTAFNVVGNDDLGLDRLSAVGTITADPATGFAVTEPPGAGDPGFTYEIESIPAGGSVTITYSGMPLPSDELEPGAGQDPRFSPADHTAALIDNITDIVSYTSTDSGGVTYTGVTEASVEAYVHTPRPWVGASICTQPSSGTRNVTVSLRNHLLPLDSEETAPGAPPAGVGIAENGEVVVVLGNNVSPGGTTYTLGSATYAGVAITPGVSTDADGNQVLTFDVGDLEWGGLGQLDFRVDYLPSNAIPSLSVTYSAEDGSGAGTRGESVGAGFEYSADDSSLFCPTGGGGGGGSVGYGIEKTPDEAFAQQGDPIDWEIRAGGNTSGPLVFSDVVFTDTLPLGVTYTGPAQFQITKDDGTTATFTMAGVVSGQEIVWDMALAPEPIGAIRFAQITVPSVVDADADTSAFLVNTFEMASDVVTISDTGSVRPVGPGSTVLTKTVTNLSRDDVLAEDGAVSAQFGDVMGFTVDVQIPANASTLFDARIVDQFDPAFTATGTIFDESLVCVSGCSATDPTIVPFEPWIRASDGAAMRRGFFLGDLEPNVAPRVYRWSYKVPTVDITAWVAGPQGQLGTWRVSDNTA